MTIGTRGPGQVHTQALVNIFFAASRLKTTGLSRNQPYRWQKERKRNTHYDSGSGQPIDAARRRPKCGGRRKMVLSLHPYQRYERQ
jgi:hypothetical protein